MKRFIVLTLFISLFITSLFEGNAFSAYNGVCVDAIWGPPRCRNLTNDEYFAIGGAIYGSIAACQANCPY